VEVDFKFVLLFFPIAEVTVSRALSEPRPSVVGLGWVVECAEKLQRIPEKRFEVDLSSASLMTRKVSYAEYF
jgi:hypothetical protein